MQNSFGYVPISLVYVLVLVSLSDSVNKPQAQLNIKPCPISRARNAVRTLWSVSFLLLFSPILSTLSSSICSLLSALFTFLRNQCGEITENNLPGHLIGKFQSSGSTIGSNRMRRLRKLWYVYLEQYIFKVYFFYLITVCIYQPNSTCCILTSASESWKVPDDRVPPSPSDPESLLFDSLMRWTSLRIASGKPAHITGTCHAKYQTDFATYYIALMTGWNFDKNSLYEIINKYKKVLLRERKRHTDRRVASTRYAAPAGGGGGGYPGWAPHLDLDGWGGTLGGGPLPGGYPRWVPPPPGRTLGRCPPAGGRYPGQVPPLPGGLPWVGAPCQGGTPGRCPPTGGVPQAGAPLSGGTPGRRPLPGGVPQAGAPLSGGTPGRRPLPGGTPGRYPPAGGYPGWAPPHLDLDGYPPHLDLDGVPPCLDLDGVPPCLDLDGVPPPPGPGWGTPPPQSAGWVPPPQMWTDKQTENITSSRTTYAVGNNI